MKNLKRFILSLLLFFFISSPTIVLAQPNQATATGVRETVREEIREKTATVQARLS